MLIIAILSTFFLFSYRYELGDVVISRRVVNQTTDSLSPEAASPPPSLPIPLPFPLLSIPSPPAPHRLIPDNEIQLNFQQYTRFCPNWDEIKEVDIHLQPIPSIVLPSIAAALFPPTTVDYDNLTESIIDVGWQVDEGYIPYHYMQGGAVRCSADRVCDMRCDVPCRMHMGSPGQDANVRLDWTPSEPQTPLVVHYQSEPAKVFGTVDPVKMRHVDLVMSAYRDAHVWMPAHNDKFYTWTDNRPDSRSYRQLFCEPVKEKDWSVMATVFMHSSYPERRQLINELGKRLTILKFGNAFGRSMPTNFETSRAAREMTNQDLQYHYKMHLIASHPFYLAFENDQHDDWVTEKVYHGLIAGSVPIYWGADNIDEYVPVGSIIKVGDFKSVDQLADHLLWLSANPDEYSRYFEWKRPPYHLSVSVMMQASKTNNYCGLCRVVRNAKQQKFTRIYYNLSNKRFEEITE